MTLLITALAAVTTTIVWYLNAPKSSELRLSILCFMYWGASIMWFVDAIFEFAELKEEYFNPAPADMLNDAFLGFSVVVLGLMIWAVILLIKDPKGVIRGKLIGKKKA